MMAERAWVPVDEYLDAYARSREPRQEHLVLSRQRRCSECGTSLPPATRRPRLTCSPRCRSRRSRRIHPRHYVYPPQGATIFKVTVKRLGEPTITLHVTGKEVTAETLRHAYEHGYPGAKVTVTTK